MNDISREIKELLIQYGMDIKQAMKEHSRLDYLYALSDMRESLLEWYPFKPDGTLLQVGSDYGALTGLYSRRVAHVVVLDESADNLEVNRMRHQEDNITFVQEELTRYAQSSREDGCLENGFDYVVLAGSMTEDCIAQAEAAKSLLKPGGELIVAVCNSLGMKYWAGAEKDEHSMSRNALIDLFGGNEMDLEFYYPMPDYKLPVTIYSQSHLPVKGDLTKTVQAYDFPQYPALDVGASYDAVCEDGQFENFANSFLVIWRSHGTN